MEKYEKINNIRECISKIEEDVTSACNSGCYDRETLMTKNVLECLKAVSGLLEDIVSESNPASNNRFFITEEQQDELKIISNATVTDIANEINRVTENNNKSKITTTWITDWLISVNILEINNSGERVPTKIGKDKGITSKLIQVSYNRMQNVNYYPLEMQMFIYDNIESIINFHYNCKPKTAEKKSRNQFFITDEQRLQLKIVKNAKISDIANELNKFAQENCTKKITAVWITNWFLEMGILQKNDSGNRIPTQKGTAIGITTEQRISQDGKTFCINLYSENAQKYIYDNIKYIIDFHYNKPQRNYNFKIVSYPENMPINKFIDKNMKENIIIMSVGSCDTNLEKGSYKAALIYQNNHKVLQDNIITRSANKCILCGIKKAVETIKKPSDVMIISPTLLGFGTRKSANYDICEEIIDILTNKNCNIKIITCEGMGFEIRNYINILSKSI